MQLGEEFNPYMRLYGLFIPNSIAMSDIPLASKFLLGRLMQFAGKDGKAYPTRKRLMKELCFGKGQLDRAIRNLKDLKLIKTVKKDSNNQSSPNEYRFLYHKIYEEPLTKTKNTPLTANSNTPLTANSNTPLTANSNTYNRRSIIDDVNNREFFSKEKKASSKVQDCNGMVCSICGENQYRTKSGDVCINGHGGTEGIKKEEFLALKKTSLQKIKTKKLKKIKSSGLTRFNYSTQAKQILKFWENQRGKIHVTKNAKGAVNIQYMIDCLLQEGWNPYIHLVDNELRTKKWTVSEICKCIKYYTCKLKKDISNLYFDQFVLYKQRGKFGRSQPDYSILAETFQNLPKDSRTFKFLEKWFSKRYPNVHIYPTSLTNIANFLDSKIDDYKITDPGNNSYLPLMFTSYISKQVSMEGKYDPLIYMSGKENLNKFFKLQVKSHLVQKRTKEEKKQWLIDKSIMEKNRQKALKQKVMNAKN